MVNKNGIDRRYVVKAMAAGVIAAPGFAHAATGDSRKSIVIVGCGSRAHLYQDAI